MLTLSNLLSLLLLLLFCWYWWKARAVQERAFQAAKSHCEQMQVQLLDDSVFLSGFKLTRDASGMLRVQRTYSFEFTATGDSRYPGKVRMVGAKLAAIELAPHRI